MKILKDILPGIIGQAAAADIEPLRTFLLSNPGEALIATGSGGAETAGDLAALLYGARGGVATSVSPYTLHSYSDAALRTAKVLLVSKGGHNNDIVFAARRALSVHPEGTASFALYTGERNEVRKVFLKTGAGHLLDAPLRDVHDGFVSVGTPIAYYALLTRVFQPDVDLDKYCHLPEKPFTLCRRDGSSLRAADIAGVRHFVILHGSWGRPVAANLEGKLVESGFATAGVYDYRNYTHGRFIFTSNHLEDSVVVMLVSPREQDIAARTREFLPSSARLVVIETEQDAPEASLDLLIRATAFFGEACVAAGVDPECPANPGRIDKRVPMWIPFKTEMKRNGPLALG